MTPTTIRRILYPCLAIGAGIWVYANLTYDPINDRKRPLDPSAICRTPDKFPPEWSRDCPKEPRP